MKTAILRRSARPAPRRASVRRLQLQRLETRRLLTVDLGLEDVGAELTSEAFWNGPDPEGNALDGPFGDTVVVGRFSSGNAWFNNAHSLDFGSWNGWAYSNTTDATTPGFENQYSAFTGNGVAGSSTYAVAFQDTSGFFALPSIHSVTPESPLNVSSLMITNTTNAALSMLEGDAFARRFGWLDQNGDGDFEDVGDEAGSHPDWFLLTIEGLDARQQPVGTVDFYLADYRFEDAAQDYVVDSWTAIDTSSLTDAVQLNFELTSSDTGMFGMNTPAYFALDRADIGLEALAAELNDEDFWSGPDPDGVQRTGAFGDAIVEGTFAEDGLQFNNVHSLDFGSWVGWSYSNTTDTETPGYLNQYSSFPGSGAGNSQTYGVAFQDLSDFYAPPTVELTVDGFAFASLEVTNTTNAALSMLQGDAFARRFGWLDANHDGDFEDAADFAGDFPDWFLLTIEGVTRDGSRLTPIETYLADYRSSDPSQDYVVDQWTRVDLAPLATAVRLEFRLSSSDEGDFGMNTPAYFAADQIQLAPIEDAAPQVVAAEINVGTADPPDLPVGKQPTAWSQQRSVLRSLDLHFSEPMDWRTLELADWRLINLGINAPSEDDQDVSLLEATLIPLDDARVRLELPQLNDGVYQLTIGSALTDLSGNPLTGESGVPGSFEFTGDATNQFYQLTADWNGDQGVSVFDLPALSYWFGTSAPDMPAYVDANHDGGISIFDLPFLVSNFGDAPVFPHSELVKLVARPNALVVSEKEWSERVPQQEFATNRRQDAALLALLADWTTQRRPVEVLLAEL